MRTLSTSFLNDFIFDSIRSSTSLSISSKSASRIPSNAAVRVLVVSPRAAAPYISFGLLGFAASVSSGPFIPSAPGFAPAGGPASFDPSSPPSNGRSRIAASVSFVMHWPEIAIWQRAFRSCSSLNFLGSISTVNPSSNCGAR